MTHRIEPLNKFIVVFDALMIFVLILTVRQTNTNTHTCTQTHTNTLWALEENRCIPQKVFEFQVCYVIVCVFVG